MRAAFCSLFSSGVRLFEACDIDENQDERLFRALCTLDFKVEQSVEVRFIMETVTAFRYVLHPISIGNQP